MHCSVNNNLTVHSHKCRWFYSVVQTLKKILFFFLIATKGFKSGAV